VAHVGFELDEVAAVESHVNHFAFMTLVESDTGEAGASAFEVVEDVVLDFVDAVGDDEDRLVGCDALDDQVDDLAFDIDKYDGVYRQSDVADDEGGEGDAAVDDEDEDAERYFGVFVDDHRDDVAAARGGAGAEDDADGDAVDEACDNGVEEEIGDEETFDGVVAGAHDVGDMAVEAFGGVVESVVDDRSVAPCRLKDVGEYGDKDDGDDGLDAESGAEDDGADDEQGYVHADTCHRYFPSEEGIENVGETVDATRSKVVGVDKHYVAYGEQETSESDESVGDYLVFEADFFLHLVLYFICLQYGILYVAK